MKTIWKGLCLFFYRRWATADKVKPVGIPGNAPPADSAAVGGRTAGRAGTYRIAIDRRL